MRADRLGRGAVALTLPCRGRVGRRSEAEAAGVGWPPTRPTRGGVKTSPLQGEVKSVRIARPRRWPSCGSRFEEPYRGFDSVLRRNTAKRHRAGVIARQREL